MLSRRELFTTGIAGGLSAGSGGAAGSPSLEQEANREGQREIVREIGQVEDVLRQSFLSSSLAHGFVAKIRPLMEQFLRGNGKFPDFFEIGPAVFMDLYDWHVKHRQQLTVTRQPDGRYTMQFMFSTMVLRPDQDPGYVGYPYDKG